MTSRLVTFATLLALVLAACSSGTPAAAVPIGTAPPPPTAPARSVALGIMMQSQEIIIGNDDIEDKDSPARYLGYLKSVKTAVERAGLARLTSATSEAMLITYDDRAKVRVPLGSINELTPAAFGTQKDYFKTAGSDAGPAFDLALSQLGRAHASHRILVVLGDGNSGVPLDTAVIREKAREAHVEIVGLIYKGQLSDDATAMAPLFARSFKVRDAGELEAALREVVLAR